MNKIFVPVNIYNVHWCMAVVYVQEKVRVAWHFVIDGLIYITPGVLQSRGSSFAQSRKPLRRPILHKA